MKVLLAEGPVQKMRTQLAAAIQYRLPLGESEQPMNELLGSQIELRYLGAINCIHCARTTKTSFGQGYCYPCFTRLAQCDSCIMSPEKCHYAAGTCREPEWGETHCMIEHVVYLANTSGVKVGITRGTQVPTRWMDQGAVQALPVFAVQTRLQSGLVETVFKQHVADRTNWRAMLKGEDVRLDLKAERDQLVGLCQAELSELQQRFGLQAIQLLEGAEVQELNYPVLEYPGKVVSHNLDKEPVVQGELRGIKGQYLILDSGVINMRKYGGYQLALSANQ